MKLADVVETSDAVAATSSRREKIELVAAAVRALSPEEARAGAACSSAASRGSTRSASATRPSASCRLRPIAPR